MTQLGDTYSSCSYRDDGWSGLGLWYIDIVIYY